VKPSTRVPLCLLTVLIAAPPAALALQDIFMYGGGGAGGVTFSGDDEPLRSLHDPRPLGPKEFEVGVGYAHATVDGSGEGTEKEDSIEAVALAARLGIANKWDMGLLIPFVTSHPDVDSGFDSLNLEVRHLLMLNESEDFALGAGLRLRIADRELSDEGLVVRSGDVLGLDIIRGVREWQVSNSLLDIHFRGAVDISLQDDLDELSGLVGVMYNLRSEPAIGQFTFAMWGDVSVGRTEIENTWLGHFGGSVRYKALSLGIEYRQRIEGGPIKNQVFVGLSLASKLK